MRILKNTVMGIDPIYPLDRLSDISKIMFLDIETTGLSPVNSIVYLIGAAYCSGGTWKTVQFFADSPSEESQIIYSFFNFAAAFDTLITYNGNKFDIPFLEERVNSYDLPYNFTLMRGIDIYKRIKPYKCMFALADLRQKSVEHFMGIDRDDEKSGSELIGLYQAYTENPNEYALNLILQHNFDDICGMLKIIPVLSYSDIANTGIRADKATRNKYKDYSQNEKSEIIIEFSFENPVPIPVSCGFEDCYLMLGGNRGKIRVALYVGELKFFHPDFKDYFYLPEEDTAIHKSVSSYVDKDHREQAKASNCYTKKSGEFLPEWEEIVRPVFRENYKDSTMYFELTEDIKRSPEIFTKYAEHLINMIIYAKQD